MTKVEHDLKEKYNDDYSEKKVNVARILPLFTGHNSDCVTE